MFHSPARQQSLSHIKTCKQTSTWVTLYTKMSEKPLKSQLSLQGQIEMQERIVTNEKFTCLKNWLEICFSLILEVRSANILLWDYIYFEQIPKPLRQMFLYMKWEIAILTNEFCRKMINHLCILIMKLHW